MLELDHPNIIKLHRAIEGKRKYIMVMEYVGDNTLYETIEYQKKKMLAESRMI